MNQTVPVEISGKRLEVPKWRAWRDLPKTAAVYMPAAVAEGMTPSERWSSLVECLSNTYVRTVALTDKQVKAELARIPHDDAFLEVVRSAADDLSRRFDAARREGREVYARPDLTNLLFGPLLRAQHPLVARWAAAVHMGSDAKDVFAALPVSAREAILLERVPLDGVLGLGISAALSVLHLTPTRPALEHLNKAIARVEAKDADAAGKYRRQLAAVARAHSEVKKILVK